MSNYGITFLVYCLIKITLFLVVQYDRKYDLLRLIKILFCLI